MIDRIKIEQIRYLIENFPAVALLGPRQVGKTTLAKQIGAERDSIYLDLELERDRAKLADREYYLDQHRDKLVILDEIHRIPELFQSLRGLIDGRRDSDSVNGSFLLLGSASIDLLKQSGETLAGRISFCELHPLNILEVEDNNLERLWLRGGFPDSFLKNDKLSYTWRHDFIRTYLERDIPQFGPRIAAETLRRFWTMIAHIHGGLLNAAQLSRSLGVDNKTIANYLDLLVDLLLVRRLQPWHENTGKRLVKSPKIYLRDSGLVHALLQIPDFETLLSYPKLGDSWEGFVIENVLSAAPEHADAYFYRTSAGAEIDLVIRFGRRLWAIEVKRSTAPKLTKGFHIACQDINPTAKWVVYPGSERYPLTQDVTAISLPDLIREFIQTSR